MNSHNDDNDDFPGEEGQELENAHQALELGDYQEALELLEDYLEEHPLDVEAMTLGAMAASHQGDAAKSAALYRLILRLDPENATAHHYFGVLLEGLGRYEEAISHLLRARDLQPDFPEIYLHAGHVLDHLGRAEEALNLYDEALLRLPDEALVYFSRGCVLNRLGRYREALDCFARVPANDPQGAAALSGAGSALSGLGRDQEALTAHERAIALNPRVATYRYDRGLTLARLERFSEALDEFDAALDLDSGFLEAALEKVNVLIQVQRPDESLKVLGELELRQPDNAQAAYFRGVVLQRLGDLEGAQSALRESLSRDPGATPVLNFLGHVLLELERLDEALGCFDTVLARRDSVPSANYDRARIFARRGQVRLALRDLRQAVKADSRYLEAAKSDASFDGVRDSTSFRRLLAAGHG